MQEIYIIFIIFFLIYTILNNSHVDIFFISFWSSVIYFSPLLFGYVSLKYKGLRFIEPISEKLYVLHFIFIVALLFSHFINQYFSFNFAFKLKVKKFDDVKSTNVLFLIWCILFIFYIILFGDSIFSYKTTFNSPFLARYKTIYDWILIGSVIANYKVNKYKNIMWQIPAIMITIIQGHRSYTILILFAIVVDLLLSKKLKIISLKNFILGGFLFIFGFLGKRFISILRSGFSFNKLFDNLLKTDIIIEKILFSEPFVTQYILNETLQNEIGLNISYLKRLILKIFFISPEFTNINHFYENFVANNYPDISYGIAYNIFAEAYYILNYLGVIFFILFYVLALFIIQKLIKSNNRFISSLGLSLSTFYVFYIYRNSFENIILWTQIFLIIYFISVVISVVEIKKPNKSLE